MALLTAVFIGGCQGDPSAPGITLRLPSRSTGIVSDFAHCPQADATSTGRLPTTAPALPHWRRSPPRSSLESTEATTCSCSSEDPSWASRPVAAKTSPSGWRSPPTRCEQPRSWERKSFEGRPTPTPISIPPSVPFWLLFGADSGFESQTAIYFTQASVTFTPIRTAFAATRRSDGPDGADGPASSRRR